MLLVYPCKTIYPFGKKRNRRIESYKAFKLARVSEDLPVELRYLSIWTLNKEGIIPDTRSSAVGFRSQAEPRLPRLRVKWSRFVSPYSTMIP